MGETETRTIQTRPSCNDKSDTKHVKTVAENVYVKTMNSMQLRLIEESKIHCAREHFKAISGDNVVYDVVDSYTSLMEKVMK